MNVPSAIFPFLPVRFKESLYAPLKFARCSLASHGCFESPTVTALPPASAALTAPVKVFNTKLERAVIELYEQKSVDAGKLQAAAESFSALAADYKQAGDEELEEEKREDAAAAAAARVAAAAADLEEPSPGVGARNGVKRPRNGPSPGTSNAAALDAAAGSSSSGASADVFGVTSAAPALGTAADLRSRMFVDDDNDHASAAARSGSSSVGSGVGRPSISLPSVASVPAGGGAAPSAVASAAAVAAAAGRAARSTPPAAPAPAPPAAQPSGPWTCPTCTFINAAATRKCDMCDGDRPSPAVPSSSAASSSAAASRATHAHLPSSFAPPPQPAAEWSCRQCTSINVGSVTTCSMCGSAKVRPAAGGSGV